MTHPHKTLSRLNANARKSFSQNFLVSPHWKQKLVDAALRDNSVDVVWEIGPGLGALTEGLVTKSQVPVVLFEMDRKLSEDLRAKFPHVTLIEGDFLKADLAPHLKTKIAILSNTPYHLSSPLLFCFVEMLPHIGSLVLTFQKEFADRLVAKPRTKEYGALSVIIQSLFSIESLGIIPPGAFFPAPKVASRALCLTPIKQDSPWGPLSEVTKTAFQHRRKKLSSNLKVLFSDEKVREALQALGLQETVRPEELTVEQFQHLTRRLTSAKTAPGD